MSLFGKKKTDGDNNDSVSKKTEAEKTVKKSNAKKDVSEAVSMRDLYSEDKKTVRSDGKKSSEKTPSNKSAYRILAKPLITEKATDLSAENKYVFMVAAGANKIEIAKAIHSVYGIKPIKVNLINIPGKRVSRGRISGQRKDRRKAVITLAKGESIKIYEGV
ncbi:MAG: 50S ribosomal protein L23 [Patescibacteria group bacterium]|jgi:large subunit ribosomal protein L23